MTRDFSASSIEAVNMLIKLADKFDAEISLLHVLHNPTEGPGFYPFKKAGLKVLRNMEEVASETRWKFCDNYLKEWAKLNARVVPCLPADEIVRFAEKEKADMVVMGARGHSAPTETTTPIRPARVNAFRSTARYASISSATCAGSILTRKRSS